MTTARTLLLGLLAVIPDGERAAPFFAEDGVVELPFLHAIGIPTRYQGHVAIGDFFNFVGRTLYPGFGFRPEDIDVLIETPDQVFAEYTAHTTAARTGRVLHHLFAGRLVARNGKITLLRESLNTVAAAQALNPNGVADLPPPESEIFSVPPDYLR
jgi:ketosteroid isomerase-like protein